MACPRAAALALLAGTAVFAGILALPSPPVRADTPWKVVEIVDGDTLRVRSGGEIRTVRLIGIDAPERSHPSKQGEFLADESADRLAYLCGGKTVRMESGGEDADRHGRLLRYVFLPSPDGRLVNREMVREGHARVYRRFPFSREEEFSRAEAEAKREGRGVWRDGGMAEVRWLIERRVPAVEIIPISGDLFAVAYAGMARTGVGREGLAKAVREIVALRAEHSDRDFAEKAAAAGFVPVQPGDRGAIGPSPPPAAPPTRPLPQGVVSWEDAHRNVGREVEVEGTVVRTHRSRKVLYLNFHPNWKKYLTVVVFARDLGKFPKDAAAYYKGKTVRVRGMISRYKGRPEMIVRSPKQIMVVK